MKALFINPPIYDFSAFDLWNKPYGFLLIVDLFVQNGWDVLYFDFMDRNHRFYEGKRKDKNFGCGRYYCQVIDKPAIYKDIPRTYKRFGLPAEFFIEFIEKTARPDVILLTCGMTYWYMGVKELLELCRNRVDAPIILGGTYATFCPDHCHSIGVDLVFQGGDISAFIDFFNNQTDFSLKPVKKLMPYWNIYTSLSYLVARTSVGCPFSCYYCGANRIHSRYILRDVNTVANEICKNVERFGINDVAFYDDALLCNFETHLKRIIERCKKTISSVNFHTPNGVHPRFITEDIARFLKDADFKTIRLSVESFDEKRQKESGFKIVFSEFENAMKNLVDAGFPKRDIGVYILAGLPEQTFDDVLCTIRILKQFPCTIKIAEYSPIPGTRDYEIARTLYPFLPLEEPLFQNNSIFPLWNFENKWEKINQIKHLAHNDM